MKKIIWALFDDGIQSVYNALDHSKYKIYSIGIQKKETVINIDLAQNFNNLIKELNKLPKPEIIVASPVCTPFSSANIKPKNFIGKGNLNFIVENEKLIIRNENEFNNSRFNYKKQIKTINLGISCITNTLKIINYYKPKFWYIENPKTSLLWKYIENNLNLDINFKRIYNKTYYANYDFITLKPTIFLSNINLNLNNKKPNFIGLKDIFGQRGNWLSHIPKKLIQEIFNKFDKNIEIINFEW